MKKAEHSSAPEDIKLLKHILQMTNEQTPYETVYYVEESNKIHVTELFDISDCEDTNLQTAAERELNQMLEFDIDDWGDADFGCGGDDDEEDFPDDDLFPVDAEETAAVDAETNFSDDVQRARLAACSDKAGVEEGLLVQDEDLVDGEEELVDPYFFTNMTARALNMSQEYNEMVFGTYRHLEAESTSRTFSDTEDEVRWGYSE